MPNQEYFVSEIKKSGFSLSPEQIQRAALFAVNLYQENELQNLTRIPPKDFVDGHLRDVIELIPLPSLGSCVLDVGSGSGVPGLLAAAIDTNAERKWILSEAEKNKCDYLLRGIERLGLHNVSTLPGRIERLIFDLKIDTVTARAVGTVDKIAGWIWDCSTWNNLILFKSVGWAEEWEKGKTSRFGKKLTVTHQHEYVVADKFRTLITLKRK